MWQCIANIDTHTVGGSRNFGKGGGVQSLVLWMRQEKLMAQVLAIAGVAR
jgi:hypothetical protein